MAQSKSVPLQDFLSSVTSTGWLRERYFPGLTEVELESLLETLGAVSERVQDWCTNWSIFNIPTIIPVSLVNLSQFHVLDHEAILLRIKHSLWTYALDDMFDDDALTELDVIRIVRECELTACSLSCDVGDSELARSLREIQVELTRAPGYARLYPLWVSTLIATFNGMMYERWLQRRLQASYDDTILPSYDEYIHYGRDSIAITHLWITGLMLERDREAETLLPGLYELAEQCAIVVRLANDLATFARERREHVVNAVALSIRDVDRELGLHPLDGEAEAVVRVRARLALERDRLDVMAARLPTQTMIAERYARATQLSADIYSWGDVRSWKTRLEAELGARLNVGAHGDS